MEAIAQTDVWNVQMLSTLDSVGTVGSGAFGMTIVCRQGVV